MKNDDKVIAKIPADEKQEIIDLGTKLDLSVSQIIREALQRIRPLLVKRVSEREKAVAVKK